MNKNINIYFSDGMDEYFLYCNAIISFFFLHFIKNLLPVNKEFAKKHDLLVYDRSLINVYYRCVIKTNTCWQNSYCFCKRLQIPFLQVQMPIL